ncbi:D-alanyl-D-alanine carboxypeptidase (penicillin-binding protein 5/6) [Desulfomicrobium apsheronum]|uniref:D-alanyl-D-alanine carboxypeptidase (Penicillin-binding protein 5/6) n=1 Tax=Desulfomicrobium apsheronum TaxID=52560 RepID=A0A1I3Z1Z5_9BACT|nr:D-alanyl-D-alanine carboxypeptidase family protein [Desulfomicrobium apsheronum]MDY0228418.1 serine hydrolase [Desulfomicrobium apsheronum]SFK38113.1 D-alanyl-D-alanine carboxypeptidase (penicillin-binding protein 5/6) [Desulfomicrobium apsheronum]
MTKKCAARFLILLAVYALISGLAGIGFSAFASSGTHVFRAAVVPRPGAVGPDTQALDRAEPVKAVSSAPQPSVKKTSSSKTTPAAPKSQAAGQAATPAPKQAAKPQAAEAKAKKSSDDKSAPAKQAVKPGTSKDLYLNAQAALLINMSTGEVYYEHNPDKAIQPASITKLLTLYIIREALAQGKLAPTTPIPVSAAAVKTGGSRMRLKRNEKVPLSELIKGISVVSANNACVAVAEYFGKGDPSKFVAQMNAKAKKIGMINSRFKNPNGLPASGQLSTARDIAKLSVAYLRTFPESLKVHSMTSHTYHGATHRNANTLLRTYKGVDGLKTGFVCDAGYNITATAKRGKTRLVAVVLGAQNSAVRQRETARLLDYGFRRAAKAEKLAKKASGAAKKPEA